MDLGDRIHDVEFASEPLGNAGGGPAGGGEACGFGRFGDHGAEPGKLGVGEFGGAAGAGAVAEGGEATAFVAMEPVLGGTVGGVATVGGFGEGAAFGGDFVDDSETLIIFEVVGFFGTGQFGFEFMDIGQGLDLGCVPSHGGGLNHDTIVYAKDIIYGGSRGGWSWPGL